jgi:hypothetical protein
LLTGESAVVQAPPSEDSAFSRGSSSPVPFVAGLFLMFPTRRV